MIIFMIELFVPLPLPPGVLLAHQFWMPIAGDAYALLSMHAESWDLCHSLTLLIRKLFIFFVDPIGLSAFLTCHLMALDKFPGT